MITVKHGDKYPITFQANMDLTGSTVRLLAQSPGSDTVELPCTITDGPNGIVTHGLDGTLEPRTYWVELEVTQGEEIVTFPSNGHETLQVLADLG